MFFLYKKPYPTTNNGKFFLSHIKTPFLAGLWENHGIMITWITINRKVNRKPDIIKKETSEMQLSFSGYQ